MTRNRNEPPQRAVASTSSQAVLRLFGLSAAPSAGDQSFAPRAARRTEVIGTGGQLWLGAGVIAPDHVRYAEHYGTVR
ncbi:MAG TPA: hypothetical protein VF796_18235, partial [Humisphaera sp.]